MVSIRYFCGVGEFCRMKSSPCGKLTSNIGATRAATDRTDVIKSDMRSSVFSNLGSLSGLAYPARGFRCTRLRLEFRGNTPPEEGIGNANQLEKRLRY